VAVEFLVEFYWDAVVFLDEFDWDVAFVEEFY
jgi:hypothetical protein